MADVIGCNTRWRWTITNPAGWNTNINLDDSAWDEDSAPICGYGANIAPESKIVNTGCAGIRPDVLPTNTTVRFRTILTLTTEQYAAANLILRGGVDNGATVWVNGTQVHTGTHINGTHTWSGIDVTPQLNVGDNLIAFQMTSIGDEPNGGCYMFAAIASPLSASAVALSGRGTIPRPSYPTAFNGPSLSREFQRAGLDPAVGNKIAAVLDKVLAKQAVDERLNYQYIERFLSPAAAGLDIQGFSAERVSVTHGVTPLAGQGFRTVPFSVVSFGSENWDDSTFEYTVPDDGYFLITARLRLADNEPSYNYGLGVHTSNIDGPWMLWADTSTVAAQKRSVIQVTRFDRFLAGQKLRAYAYLDIAGNRNVGDAKLDIIFLGDTA